MWVFEIREDRVLQPQADRSAGNSTFLSVGMGPSVLNIMHSHVAKASITFCFTITHSTWSRALWEIGGMVQSYIKARHWDIPGEGTFPLANITDRVSVISPEPGQAIYLVGGIVVVSYHKAQITTLSAGRGQQALHPEFHTPGSSELFTAYISPTLRWHRSNMCFFIVDIHVDTGSGRQATHTSRSLELIALVSWLR